MGQVLSLSELEDCVRAAFSDRVLVSSGLFGSSYPRGTYIKCEVDLAGHPAWGGWNVDKSELVVQIVKDNQISKIRDGKCEGVPKPLYLAEVDNLDVDSTVQSSVWGTLKLLYRFSPGINIEDASFDLILKIMRHLNVSTDNQEAFTKQHNESTKSSENTKSLFVNAGKTSAHANIVPVLGACIERDTLFIIYPPTPFTLESILYFSPNALNDDWEIRFLVYQLLSAVAFCHDHGIVHGNLKLSNILLTETLWCWVTGFHLDPFVRAVENGHSDFLNSDVFEDSELWNWQMAFRSWFKGELSNYDYILVLNKLAGRRWGDRKFHIVMPWVIDFSVKPEEASLDGWRDLTKSKWRLAKGDEQLDFTYATAEIPHHVSDECISELAVCIYKARRLPLFVLKQTVRSVYEPNEYPASLQRLYQWTPDECIPEFYSDASIFSSLHAGMSDLAVPCWAENAEKFITLHRDALEGQYVSDNLHHWIDLTFGYKLSGEAAIAAKNVTLSTSNPALPRAQGRRQLFLLSHPKRQCATVRSYTATSNNNTSNVSKSSHNPISTLESLEEVSLFCQHSRHLSPIYKSNTDKKENVHPEKTSLSFGIENEHKNIDASHETLDKILETLKVGDDSGGSYQEQMLWEKHDIYVNIHLKDAACDIFALGCIVAELYLRKPLFDIFSLRNFKEHGVEPSSLEQLPLHAQTLVRYMINCNPVRNISAKKLLASPFFPPSVRAVHSFVSMLYLYNGQQNRIQFASLVANLKAFLLMGPFAATKCIRFCLSALVIPHENIPVKVFLVLLDEILVALKPHDAKELVLPFIQKILKGQENTELKLSLLQSSLVTRIFKSLGRNMYLEHLHHAVLHNLQQSSESALGAAASTLLIETCKELGIPATFNQTIIPLLHQFGRDISHSAIETVVRIGKELGDCMIVKHLLPSLRAMVTGCLNLLPDEKKGPVKTWRMLVMRDAVSVLEQLVSALSSTVVFMEFVQEPHNVLEALLLNPAIDSSLQQCAAKAVLTVCQSIGPDAIVAYVLPWLERLFNIDTSTSVKNDLEIDASKKRFPDLSSTIDNVDSIDLNAVEKLKDQEDLLCIIVDGLASLLGIDRLRNSLHTSVMVEQLLVKHYGWKWEREAGFYNTKSENISYLRKPYSKFVSDFSPSSLLLTEIGWSLPQPTINKSKPSNNEDFNKNLKVSSEVGQGDIQGPWMWLPTSESCWDGTEYLNRPGLGFGSGKNERPWNVKATVCHSWRAHSGSLKTIAVGDGEITVFTAGLGSRMRGSVKKWQLSTAQSVMEYSGHEEAVNDICVIPSTNKVASCDGTIHLWDTRTGECMAIFSESAGSSNSLFPDNGTLQTMGIVTATGTTLSNGILSTGFHGSQYTCMHLIDNHEKLIAGIGNGHIRFFDLPSGKSLYLWRCDLEISGSSLISAIASSGNVVGVNKQNAFPSWISVGFSMGQCRLLDTRTGNFIGSWRAHDGFITKLAAFDDYYLVSSSLDRTLCLWDIRRNPPAPVCNFQGHNHGVSSFDIWSNNLLSAGGNRIGITNLSPTGLQDSQTIRCYKLFSPDLSNLNLSSITTLSILPFSRLFVVGTDDGVLRVCR